MKASVVLLVIAAVSVTIGACHDTVVCGGLEVIGFTIPDTTTIKVGASTIAIAGEDYGTCGPRPARDFVWTVSDSTIVAVTPFDSVYASIRGLRVGHATVTPKYRASGAAVMPVNVTVVP